jgi:hypothetical protein
MLHVQAMLWSALGAFCAFIAHTLEDGLWVVLMKYAMTLLVIAAIFGALTGQWPIVCTTIPTCMAIIVIVPMTWAIGFVSYPILYLLHLASAVDHNALHIFHVTLSLDMLMVQLIWTLLFVAMIFMMTVTFRYFGFTKGKWPGPITRREVILYATNVVPLTVLGYVMEILLTSHNSLPRFVLAFGYAVTLALAVAFDVWFSQEKSILKQQLSRLYTRCTANQKLNLAEEEDEEEEEQDSVKRDKTRFSISGKI